MTLGAIGSSTSILQTLETKGLSASKAKLVQSDLDASIQASAGLSGAKPDITAVRGALDQKIAADVASGALTQEDAAAVSKTLDDLQGADGSSSTTAAAAAPAAAAATGSAGGAGSAGGGGGGGGSSEKTEVSRSVVVTGAIETTTITYTDGTTTTEVSASTGDDAKQAGGARPVETAGADQAGSGYKPRIVPGILVDALA